MPAQMTDPPLAIAASAAGTRAPTGAKNQRGVQRLGGRNIRSPSPHSSESARERLSCGVARPGKREHLLSAKMGDLSREVRRCAEPIEADPRCIAREPKCAVTNQPCAKQRRRLHVGKCVRYGKAVTLVGNA